MTSASSMNEAGHPQQVLWDNQRDRVEREVASGWGEHMYTCSQFMLMYGKNHHNIVMKYN